MAGDTDFDKVVLLVQFAGSDGSTTFTDSSSYARTLTAVGSAQIDTAISKFGGSSGLFPTDTNGVTAPYTSSLQLGANDFDIAGWVYPTSNVDMDFISHRNIADSLNFWAIRRKADGTIRTFFKTAGTTIIDLTSTNAAGINTWSYVQVTRIGSAFKLYVNGTLGASGTSATSITSTTYPLWLGAGDNSGAGGFIGQLDDVRITIAGAARSTIVPTSAFPTSMPTISGSVLDSTGTAASRTIRVYRRDSGALLGSGVSTSGSYSIGVPFEGEVNVICLDDVAGTTENDLILRTVAV